VNLDIVGLGVVFYAPFAVRHISEGADYLAAHFRNASDVAQHVMACEISTFGTGSSGRYRLLLYDDPIDHAGLEEAARKVRLGIEVRDQTLCFRDLYDLMHWSSECPKAQQIAVPDGFYRITAYTSAPESGVLGDDQEVALHLERVPERPTLRWAGVPDLTVPVSGTSF
jgi:hypothetical protein